MATTETKEFLILRAVDFAARKHRDQRRKDEEASPYINHPISVSLLLAEIGGITDPEVLSAAILHDTVEDTDTTLEELEAAFGMRVRRLVEEVTDDKRLRKAERKQRQIDHASQLSADAVLIKLGDKIWNVLDVTHSPPKDWDLQRRREYLDWAEAVVNNCSPVNSALVTYFAKVLEDGRRKLFSA
ncbi:MAG TPA: HD domain-containing protein [Methylomirabilota bacterium]|nr:HD domain-containing protein [Methylomirabilota bacterium]